MNNQERDRAAGSGDVFLHELASVIRTKNAGPFCLTIDITFESDELLEEIVQSNCLEPSTLARMYQVDEADVEVIPFPPARAVKITLPRHVASGDIRDTDLYGAQQHRPLLDIVVRRGTYASR